AGQRPKCSNDCPCRAVRPTDDHPSSSIGREHGPDMSGVARGGQETVMMSKSTATGLSGRLHETERRHLTLIELLATIAVLGILAAIGTISTVAVTALGQQNAAASEKAMVQRAMDTMLADQGLEPTVGC